MAQIDLSGHPLWNSQDPRNDLRSRFYRSRSLWCWIALGAVLAYFGTTYELIISETGVFADDRNYWQFWMTLAGSPRATAAFVSMAATLFGTWTLYRLQTPQRSTVLILASGVAMALALLSITWNLWSFGATLQIVPANRILITIGTLVWVMAWTMTAAAINVTAAYPQPRAPRLVALATMLWGWAALGLVGWGLARSLNAIPLSNASLVTISPASGVAGGAILVLLGANGLLLINAVIGPGAGRRAMIGRRLLVTGVLLLLIYMPLLGIRLVQPMALDQSVAAQFYWFLREGLWLLLPCALMAIGLADWYKNRRFDDDRVMLCLEAYPQ